ncbi:MAG: glucose-6-phosphate isomerase [Proteobacteria bacterium]|nr:glucose-6-phosphate isomerase [Pseudomonadota bacterium]
MPPITETAAWKDLAAAAAAMTGRHLRDQFAADPKRAEVLSLDLGDLYIDYSRERIDAPIMQQLIALARAADVQGFAGRMMSGGVVNGSERRAALHTALRGSGPSALNVDGVDIRGEIARADARLRIVDERMRAGQLMGSGGKAIDTILVLGIGGSEYGPAFVIDALSVGGKGPVVRFVGNIDGVTLDRALAGIDPEAALAVVISKSFETPETQLNLAALKALHPVMPMLAVTANVLAARHAGIPDGDIYPIWDWVGGRYSLWSAVGLPIVLALGWPAFAELRNGAAEIDRHFLNQPLDQNAPVILGLIGVWNTNFMNAAARALIPYDSRLAGLGLYLQQLEMESNGKSVTVDGQPVGWRTAPVRFGAVGTNAQHTFFQMLHQGTDLVPVEFLIPAIPPTGDDDMHRALISNALAQANALMVGRADAPKDQPHRAFAGNRPSTVIAYRNLDARTLGKLIALYEHRTVVEGAIWGVNSFDQWGVELGKKMAVEIAPMLTGAKDAPASLAPLIRWLQSAKDRG